MFYRVISMAGKLCVELLAESQWYCRGFAPISACKLAFAWVRSCIEIAPRFSQLARRSVRSATPHLQTSRQRLCSVWWVLLQSVLEALATFAGNVIGLLQSRSQPSTATFVTTQLGSWQEYPSQRLGLGRSCSQLPLLASLWPMKC